VRKFFSLFFHIFATFFDYLFEDLEDARERGLVVDLHQFRQKDFISFTFHEGDGSLEG
jgi:hypothetical protein